MVYDSIVIVFYVSQGTVAIVLLIIVTCILIIFFVSFWGNENTNAIKMWLPQILLRTIFLFSMKKTLWCKEKMNWESLPPDVTKSMNHWKHSNNDKINERTSITKCYSFQDQWMHQLSNKQTEIQRKFMKILFYSWTNQTFW